MTRENVTPEIDETGGDDAALPRLGRADWARAALLPVVLVALFMIARWTGLLEWAGDREKLSAFLDRYGWRAPLVFYLCYTFLPLLFVPRLALATVGGMLFGWPSTFYTWAGALTGESITFLLSTTLARPLVAKLARRGRSRALLGWLRREGFWAVVIMRLTPMPTDSVNYGAGTAGVRYRDYLFGTAVGIFPGCVAFSYYGQQARLGLGELAAAAAVLTPAQIAIGLAILHWRVRRARRANQPT